MCISIFFHNSKLHFNVCMMCEIEDIFISSIFVQFRIVHLLDAWGMFALCSHGPPAVQTYAYLYDVVYVDTYLYTSVAYHKYYRKL